MIADTCQWHAGADRYQGSVPAAIAAYRLPLSTQRALVEQWERREFADVVTIDRDSIRGRAGQYEPELRDMNFGAAGRRCAAISRAHWTSSKVETAIVLCAEGECIAIPSVCLNVSRITRIAALPPFLAPVAGPDALPEPAGPIGDAPAAGPLSYSLAFTPIPAYSLAFAPVGFAGGGAGGFGGPELIGGAPCDACCLPVAAPVSEPAAAALLAAGVLALMVWRRG